MSGMSRTGKPSETVNPLSPAGDAGGERGPFDVWLVEIVLDTGQRYQSEDIFGRASASLELEDMRRRAMVVAVTMIELSTGEALTRPSLNLAAGTRWCAAGGRLEREILAAALDGLVS